MHGTLKEILRTHYMPAVDDSCLLSFMPLQLQSAAAQQAATLAQLSAQQADLVKQMEDSRLLIAALQGVSAKQFGVVVEALQQQKSKLQQLSVSQASAAAGLAALRRALPPTPDTAAGVPSSPHRSPTTPATRVGTGGVATKSLDSHIGGSRNGSVSHNRGSTNSNGISSSSDASASPDPWQTGSPSRSASASPAKSAAAVGTSSILGAQSAPTINSCAHGSSPSPPSTPHRHGDPDPGSQQ